MSKHDWPDIETLLKTVKPKRQPKPADEFWAEFRQRAVTEPQDSYEPSPQPWTFPKWIASAAAVLVVAFLIWAAARPRLPDVDPDPVDPIPVANVVDGNEVKSLEVFVPSGGYIIMNDQPDQGTILWITGSDEPAEDTTI